MVPIWQSYYSKKVMMYMVLFAVHSVDFRERIAHLEGRPHFHLHYADLGDSMSILGVISKVRLMRFITLQHRVTYR